MVQEEHLSPPGKIHMHLAVEVPEYEIIYTAPILFLEIVGKLYNTFILSPPYPRGILVPEPVVPAP
jgi:hypothetical protein